MEWSEVTFSKKSCSHEHSAKLTQIHMHAANTTDRLSAVQPEQDPTRQASVYILTLCNAHCSQIKDSTEHI